MSRACPGWRPSDSLFADDLPLHISSEVLAILDDELPSVGEWAFGLSLADDPVLNAMRTWRRRRELAALLLLEEK
jgi:hypothetical protein